MEQGTFSAALRDTQPPAQELTNTTLSQGQRTQGESAISGGRPLVSRSFTDTHLVDRSLTLFN